MNDRWQYVSDIIVSLKGPKLFILHVNELRMMAAVSKPFFF